MLNIPPYLHTIVNGDGAAVFDMPSDQITTLNSTGAFIWERLQQGRTVEQAASDLAVECNVDQLIVEKGVHLFLDQLKSKGLLHN